VIVASYLLNVQKIGSQVAPSSQSDMFVEPWLPCNSDSDCIVNMNSRTCCYNGNFTSGLENIKECDTKRFTGVCKCVRPKGWSSGYCTGYPEKSEQPPVAGQAENLSK
jgi:hypothetical protein